MQIVRARKGGNITPDKFKALMRNKSRMRRRPTRGERRFKSALQSAGVEFVTQRIFVDAEANKGYIADFYCEQLHLVFEVDGSSHNSRFQRAYDDVRSSLLAKRGIKVARITNEQTEDKQSTVEWVKAEVQARLSELAKRREAFRKAKHAPRTVAGTSRDEMERMIEAFEKGGGKVTKCPTVEKQGRKIKRF